MTRCHLSELWQPFQHINIFGFFARGATPLYSLQTVAGIDQRPGLLRWNQPATLVLDGCENQQVAIPMNLGMIFIAVHTGVDEFFSTDLVVQIKHPLTMAAVRDNADAQGFFASFHGHLVTASFILSWRNRAFVIL